MRKLWYAGAAIAGGIALFGATPAQADLLPGTGTAEQQADERLADLLGQSNGITVSNPLRYSSLQDTPVGNNPVAQFKAGQNSPDLNPLLPGESAGEPRPQLPAADVVGGALRRPGSGSPLAGGGLPIQQLPIRQLPIRNLPLNGLFGGGLPLLGGLNPDGRLPSAGQRPTIRQAEAFEGGVPLLGGLGGLLPVNEAPAADVPDTAGLPAGGTTVPPSHGVPAAQGRPAPAATPDDPRLHEEPIDDEASRRSFSPAGRPIGGVDPEYK